MDLFEEYLNKKDESIWVKRALTDSSYRKFAQDHKLVKNGKEIAVNTDLGTYGDAVIKLCYLEILLDKCEKLTKKKEEYESDEYFVRYVARHYGILKYLKVDSNDQKMPKNYDYEKPKKTTGKNKKESKHKYIATAVEAMIGAIFKETNDRKPIIELLKTWMEFGPKDSNESE